MSRFDRLIIRPRPHLERRSSLEMRLHRAWISPRPSFQTALRMYIRYAEQLFGVEQRWLAALRRPE